MKLRVMINRAAGTNCNGKTGFAFEKAGARIDEIYIDNVPNISFSEYQIIALPGGFTYGDDISAGKILANEIKYKLHDQFMEFMEKGNLIVGICNGFQVLVKCGILPGTNGYFSRQSVSLVANDSERFEDRWVHLKVNAERSAFTRGMDNIITLPVAHAEGKFVTDTDQTMAAIQEQIVFQYVAPNGNEADYPLNPNGSMLGIAGIADKSGRILGLMPHPERHISYLQHPQHLVKNKDKTGDGFLIFKNAVNYFKS